MKYYDQYKQIHKNKKYGVSGDWIAEKLYPVISSDSRSLLDYGAGQSNTAKLIAKALGYSLNNVYQYDPCVEGRNIKPQRTFDTVINTDVMEHVPEEEINPLLVEIWDYAEKEAIFVICLREASEILPNGENAHCTVKPKEWWKEKLEGVWDKVQPIPHLEIPYCVAAFKCVKTSPQA